MPQVDTILEYKGYPSHRFMSKCRIRIWIYGRVELSALVIMSDMAEPGSWNLSVTNGSDRIATTVVETILMPKYKIEPGRVIWVEHYEHDGENARDPIRRTSYDTVTYKWQQVNGHNYQATGPSWQRVTRQWIEELIKETI